MSQNNSSSSAASGAARLRLDQQLISNDMINVYLQPMEINTENVGESEKVAIKDYIRGRAAITSTLEELDKLGSEQEPVIMEQAKRRLVVAKYLARDDTACEEFSKNNLKTYLLGMDENGETPAEKKAKLWKEEDEFKAIGATMTTVYTTLEFLVKKLCPNEDIGSSSGECCVSCCCPE